MSRIDDVSRPVPATVQSKAPGGRRSFSSFRSSIPSSLSLPQLSLQHRPSLSVHPGRQSGSDDDGSFITGHSEFNLPSAQSSNASSNTLPTNIRSLRSRFSFGSSSPSLSNPKTSSGTLMSKFSLGPSRSGKPKVTSYPGSNDAMEAGETSDMVLTIDALSLSPQHSDPSPEPTLSEGLSGPSSNLYPSLGRGLPRTSSPLVSIRPTSSLALPPPDTQFPSSQSHSESDTLADSGLLSPKPTPRITSRRVSGSVGISYSRISEHTEPDTSLEVSKVTPMFRNQGKPSIGLDTNPGDASEDSTFGQELNSEDQVSKALVDIASSESLTNLNIPPIPKSGSILSLDRTLDQTLPDAPPLVASDAVPGNGNEISATPDEREGGSILVTSSESSDHHMDADLATILSPHQYDSRGTREPDRQDDPARSAGSARRDLTMVLSSTPAKKNTARRNSKAFTLGSGGSNVSPLSAEHSPIRNGDIDGEHGSEKSLLPLSRQTVSPIHRLHVASASTRDLSPSSPSPSPTFHRKPQQPINKHLGHPGDRPPLPRSSTDRRPSLSEWHRATQDSSTPSPFSATSPYHERFVTPGVDNPPSPEPRPRSRLSPYPGGRSNSPTPPRPYSSLSAAHIRPRRGTVDGLFRGERAASPMGPLFLRPRRSHSVDLHRPLPLENRSPTPAQSVPSRPGSRVGLGMPAFSSDWLGPRTIRAFQAAGLLDKNGEVHSHTLPEGLRRSHSPNTWHPGAPKPTNTSLGAAWRRDREHGNVNGNDGYFQTAFRPSPSDTVASDSNSGFTSSSDRFSGDHLHHAKHGSSIGHPASPVSSSRTLYSNPAANTVQALRERHELETDALLSALGQAKRTVLELQDENALLRRRNRELHAYAVELERKLSTLDRRTPSASVEEISRSRVTPRRSPLPFNNRIGPMTPEYEYPERPTNGSRISLASSITRPKPMTTVDHDRQSPTSTKSTARLAGTVVSTTASLKSRHRHSRSDASSILLPHLSGTMSMLMNEQSPAIESLTTCSADDSSPYDDIDDDALELGSFEPTARLPRRDANEHLSPQPAASPTESSFVHTSPPGSPGSLMLRTEDEIHLNELISLG